jgi:penicillin-binding protein 1A
MAGVAVLSVIAVAGFALAIYAAWLFHDMPDAGDLINYRPPTSTRVYGWDGTLIGEFSTERRIFVPYEQMPPRLVQAFMAAEDRNFFSHGGIDMTGLSRAMAKNVGNAVRGRRLEGGSTITQQVAKNVLLGNEATVGRKLKEAILAQRLEQTLDKEKILELYLNEIWLGYRSYGVAVAAYNYFGKPLSELTLAESAYLASLPKGPDNYHPIRRKAQAMARRNWVLGQMAEIGWVSQAEANAAMRDDLKVQDAPKRAAYRDADYFVEEVRRRGLNTMGEKLTQGGYYVRTTVDPEMQTYAREALMNGLEAYDRRHGWRGAWGTSEVAPGWEARAKGKTAPSERRGWRAGVVEEAGGTVRVRSVDGQVGYLLPADVSWAKAGKGLNVGDLIWIEAAENEPGRFHLRQVPAVNGALVAVEPYSGRVMAMVGGYSFSLSNFNRATQAMRQPGSSFKPFVYATALENGYTPSRVVADAPITLQGASADEVWRPQNYNRKFYGSLTLRRGLELSRNTMTVRLAQSVGMKKIVDMAQRAGVVDKMDPVLAMALGAGETTPFRITGAYAAFANGGRRVQPHLIELIQDRDGKTIFKADRRSCPGCRSAYSGDEAPRLDLLGEQVMDPVTAYQITSMLEGAVQRGTATPVRVLERPVAGKTGTTNEYRSAWFIGYTPDLVVGVFVGFDSNRSLGEGETGTTAAVPIFIDFMEDAVKDAPKSEFKPPKTAKFGMVNGIREAFKPGTEPTVAVRPSGGITGRPSSGPRPYNDVWGARPTAPPTAPPSPPPRPADDLGGLY